MLQDDPFPIQWDGLKQHCWNLREWWSNLQKAEERLDGKLHIELTANLLWFIWKARNEGVFNLHQQQAGWICKRACDDWWEWKLAKEAERIDQSLGSNNETGDQRQDQTSNGIMMIHTDAALNNVKSKAGIGIVVSNHQGKYVSTWAIPKAFGADPALLEADGIRTAMIYAIHHAWAAIVIHSDCKKVIDMINKVDVDNSLLSILVRDIIRLAKSCWRCSFCFVKRELNEASHSLAKFAINLIQEVKWEASFPIWLKSKTQEMFRVLTHQL